MKRSLKLTITLLLTIVNLSFLNAQTNETMAAGSYIIDMGVVPQTTNNALKPYGMIYALATQLKVPTKWVINPSKGKDGVDFTYQGYDFKGGPFIIEAKFRNTRVDSLISSWESQGVVGVTTTTSIIVPVATTINYFMGWTLDQQNGDKAEQYLINAGFPSTAYNWLMPSELGCCNDVFVMPHADPTWEDHSNLLSWNDSYENGGCEGTIWAACHAVSALENLFNPSNPSEQMNFLSEKTATASGSDDYADNSLVLWGDHDNGSVPYNYAYPTHPAMQFMGDMDDATTNGSEQIFIPHKKWYSTTSIAGWDPDNDEVSGQSVAAVLAFGDAFGDPDRGKVMYMGGHNHNGSNPDNIAAQRAFLNFSFWAAANKSIQVDSDVSIDSIIIQNIPASAEVNASGGSGMYTYSWSASCEGTFADPTAPSTEFTGLYDGSCIITCTVTDACGRVTFANLPIEIQVNPCNPVQTKNLIKGQAYRDNNTNAQLDASETAYSGAEVQLYIDVDNNGILNGTEGDTPLATTTTVDGEYEFTIDQPYGSSSNTVVSINTSGTNDATQKDNGDMDLNNTKLEMKNTGLYTGLRFETVNVPQNALIESAYISFRASDNKTGNVNLEISVQKSVNPAVIESSDNNISPRWDNANKVTWNVTASWSKNSWYNTVDIAPLIQSIINRTQWNSGQDILLMVRYVSGGERKAYSFNQGASSAPKLNINYKPVNYPISYITTLDQSSLPYGGSLTAASYVSSTFTDDFQALCDKELGFSVNTNVAINDINATLSNMPVEGNVIRNDFDIEGDIVTFATFLSQITYDPISSGATLSGYTFDGQKINDAGNISFDAQGNYVFTPSQDFNGYVSVSYFVCDDNAVQVCDTATLVINVGDFPNPSVKSTNGIIISDDYKASFGSTIAGSVLTNDDDVEDDNIAIQYFYGPYLVLDDLETIGSFDTPTRIGGIDRYGKFVVNAGLITFSQSGEYQFVPNAGFYGKVSIVYNACDDFDMEYKACADGELIIEVQEKNTTSYDDAPFAGDDYVSTLVNRPVTGSWIENDEESNGQQIKLNDISTLIDIDNPSGNGVLNTYASIKGGQVIFYENGTFKYTPPTDYYGPDQLAYRICDDGVTPLCDSATIYFLTSPIYYDYGDLPAQYSVAGHMIAIDFDQDVKPDLPMSIWFGEIVDHELAVQGNAHAEGDNQAGSDDEDGLIFPSHAHLGDTVDFEIKINSVDPLTTVYYGLWFDWDFDGTFDDFYSGSGITPDDDLRAVSSLTVPVILPNEDAVPMGQVGVRLRAFQSMPNASQHSGFTRAGEIEDYVMYQYRGTALPVELSYFKVKAEGNNALLSWQTEAEINNDYFSVQRSTDAVNWEEIGIVEGNGTTTEVHQYSTADKNLEADIYYYRLQQFDFDGSSEFSSVESIVIKGSEVTEVSRITVFPNPVQSGGQLTIRGQQNDVVNAIIYDVDGVEKANITTSANANIAIAEFNLESGFYILQIKDGDYIQNSKIIVCE